MESSCPYKMKAPVEGSEPRPPASRTWLRKVGDRKGKVGVGGGGASGGRGSREPRGRADSKTPGDEMKERCCGRPL